MHRLLVSFLVGLVVSSIGSMQAMYGQSSRASVNEDFFGDWSFELPDGNPAWLRIEARGEELSGALLWSVGSAVAVKDLSIQNGALRFTRRLRWQPFGRKLDLRQISEPFVARLVDNELELTFRQAAVKGTSLGPTEELVLYGKRLPPLPPTPNLDRVQFAAPIELFNGENLEGWRLSNPQKLNGWRAENGVLINETPKTDFGAYGAYGNLITEREFEDFRLTIEYNVQPGANSGIYLRGMYEAQVVDRDSKMQGINGPGAIFGRIAPTKNAGNPGGEWNKLVVTLVYRHISVELNGELVIDNQALIGCTGGGLSADVTQPGPLFLQGDHTSVRYRNISLEPVAAYVVDDSQEWKKHIVYEGAQCMTAIAGEFSGDDRLDIICNAGNATRLLVAAEEDNWREVILDQSDGHNFIHSESFDVDGDGDLDYVGARYDPGLIVWLEQPARPLEDKWLLRLVDDQVHGIHGLIKGDVDRDGKLDLLATSAQPKPPFPDSLAWFKIPADVQQAERWDRNIFAQKDAPGLTHYLGFGDVNGDGVPDAATGAKGGPADKSGSGEWFAWWEAGSDPTQVWTKHMISDTQPGATNIHPADINGDGQVDFVASRGHGRGVVWFEAPAWREHAIHSEIQEPHSLTVIDMDADGDLDAATCAFGDKLAAWFENDGYGNFKTHIVGREQEAYDIRAVDMDMDNDLDLLVAGRGSKNVVWYENPGR